MALADRSRILRLKRAGHGLQAIAALVGATTAEVDAALRNPAASLPTPGGGGGSDGAGALWKPPYGSLKTAVQDPILAGSRTGLLAGTLYLSRVYVPDPITLTKAHWIVTSAAAGLTLAELGVWNEALQLIGRTGDVKASFTSSGPKNADLSAVGGRSLDVGGEGDWLYVGAVQVGGTARAGMAGYPLATNTIASLDGTPPRTSSIGSVAALPDPIDPLGLVGGASQALWYGLS